MSWVEAIGCGFMVAWVVRVSGLTCLCCGLRSWVEAGGCASGFRLLVVGLWWLGC